MSYDKTRLAELRAKYRNAIEELVVSMTILDLLEKAGGQLLGSDLIAQLLQLGTIADAGTHAELCESLGIGADEKITLDDELFDFAFGELA